MFRRCQEQKQESERFFLGWLWLAIGYDRREFNPLPFLSYCGQSLVGIEPTLPAPSYRLFGQPLRNGSTLRWTAWVAIRLSPLKRPVLFSFPHYTLYRLFVNPFASFF
jgi:hypothetical protein